MYIKMIHKHFKTKAKFNEELAKNPSGISDSDICFIKDTGEIWTHGKLYAGTDADRGRLDTLEGQMTTAQGDISDLQTATGTTIPGLISDHTGDTDIHVTAAQKTEWSGKQDAISDLSDIRSGAGAGATAYQLPSGGIPGTDLAQAVQDSLSLADSALQNHQDITGKADKATTVTSVYYNTTSKKITQTINGETTDVISAASIVEDGGGITEHQDISGKADKTATVSGVAYDGTSKKFTKTINGITTDVVTVSTLKTDLAYTKADFSLDNVTNDAQVKRTEMGANNGVATLGSDGKIPSSQLPSYVDDVIEGYLYDDDFWEDSEHTTKITAATGRIYVDLTTEKTYRWSGSVYVEISASLVTGTTTGTAFDGKSGNDHVTNGSIHVSSTEKTIWNNKQAAISDLQTIRDGASAGATAYQLPSGGIPETDMDSSVSGKIDNGQAAYNALSGKADKVASSTAGHFAGLDASGNLTDSGYSNSSFASSGHLHDGRYYTETEVDAEFAARTMKPVDISTLTPSSTFEGGAVIGINGVFYKATQDTSEFPVTLMIEDGAFVTHTIDGKTAYIVTDSTLSEDWILWSDASIDYWINNINAQITAVNNVNAGYRLNQIESINASQSGQIASLFQSVADVTVNGQTYTIRQLLTAVAELMNQTVVVS